MSSSRMPAWLPKLLLTLGALMCIGMIIMAVLTSKESNPDKKKGLKAGAIITGVLGAIACGAGGIMMWNEHVSVVPPSPTPETIDGATAADAAAEGAKAAVENAFNKLKTGDPAAAEAGAIAAANAATNAQKTAVQAGEAAKLNVESKMEPASGSVAAAQTAAEIAAANAAKAAASAKAAEQAKGVAEQAANAIEKAKNIAAKTAAAVEAAKATAAAVKLKSEKVSTLAKMAKDVTKN